jgi:hypothetical protein
MKHRVTNFGTEPLEVRTNPETMGGAVMLMVQPGAYLDADIVRIEHGPGRTHYSVRPAERAAPTLALLEEEEE